MQAVDSLIFFPIDFGLDDFGVGPLLVLATRGSAMAQRYASFRAEDLAMRLWSTAAPAPAAQAGRGGAA